MMIDGTELIGIRRVERVGQLYLFPAKGILGNPVDTHNGSFCSCGKFERNEVIHLFLGEAYVHIGICRIAGIEAHLTLGGIFFNREKEIFCRVRDVDDCKAVTLLFKGEFGLGCLARRKAECGCKCTQRCFQ